MSGGSKGGGTGQQAATTPAPVQYGTVQPFMPGMDNLLAQQLSAGFGGNPQDFLAQFANLYAPMKMPLQSVIMSAPTQPLPQDSGPKINGQKPKDGRIYNGRVA